MCRMIYARPVLVMMMATCLLIACILLARCDSEPRKSARSPVSPRYQEYEQSGAPSATAAELSGQEAPSKARIADANSAQDAPSSPCLLVVVVTDNEDVPVPNAIVYVGGVDIIVPLQKPTSSEGVAEFEIARPAIVDIGSVASGYREVLNAGIIVAGGMRVVPITLIRNISVRFHVQTAAGPMNSSTVDVAPTGFASAGAMRMHLDHVISKLTDKNGIAEFSIVGIGSHSYRVQAPGYATVSGALYPEKESDIWVTLQSSGELVSITTVDSVTSLPKPGIRVLLSARPPPLCGSELGEGLTADDGTITFLRPEGIRSYATALESESNSRAIVAIEPSQAAVTMSVISNVSSYALVRDPLGVEVKEAALDTWGGDMQRASRSMTAGEDGWFALPAEVHMASRFRFRSKGLSTPWALVYPSHDKNRYELALGAPGAVRGRVINEAGEPVPGCIVVSRWSTCDVARSYAITRNNFIESQAITDENGEYDLSIASPGCYRIYAFHATHGAGRDVVLSMADSDRPGLLVSPAILPARLAAVTFVEPIVLQATGTAVVNVHLDGTPLPHAHVWLVPRGAHAGAMVTAKTDAKGRAVFEHLLPGVYSCIPVRPNAFKFNDVPPLLLGGANYDMVQVFGQRYSEITIRR